MKVKAHIWGFIVLLALGLAAMLATRIFIPSPQVTDKNDDHYPASPWPDPIPEPTPIPYAALAPPLTTNDLLADAIFLSLTWTYERVQYVMRVVLHNDSSDFMVIMPPPYAILEFYDGSDWRVVPRRQDAPRSPNGWGHPIQVPPGASHVIATIYPFGLWGLFYPIPLPYDVLHRARGTVMIFETPEGWHEPYVYEYQGSYRLRVSPVSPIRREDLDHDVYITFYWPNE